MTMTFDSVNQLQYKLHFPQALMITFKLIYHLPGFAEVRIETGNFVIEKYNRWLSTKKH